MTATKQKVHRAAKPQEEEAPWPHVRLAENRSGSRTFSDSVLSITMTLLGGPKSSGRDMRPASSLEKLAEQWASYIAFLASFLPMRA